jgi:hypothetical protein
MYGPADSSDDVTLMTIATNRQMMATATDIM